MYFETGRTLGLGLYLGGHMSVMTSVRVVEHTAEGLLLWAAGGSPSWQVDLPAGAHLRDIPLEARPVHGYPVKADRWHPGGSLVYQPAGAQHAVWWLFSAEMIFRGWYVNLEYRISRADDIDVVDLELDIIVAPDRTWQWKDEQSFADNEWM